MVFPNIAKRFIYFIPTVIVIILVIHLVLHFAGAVPIQIMLGEAATDESIKFWTVKLELYKPVLIQYWIWLKRFVQGDLGTSPNLVQDFSVFELIKRRSPITGILSLFSITLARKDLFCSSNFL